MTRSALRATLGFFLLLLVLPASAHERRFTGSFESQPLAAGAREIALWVMPRIGRADHYVRFDNRVALELGLSEALVSALYLNFTLLQAGAARADSLEGSVSSEWKYRLLDAGADPVGLALYGKASASTSALELEARLIIDRQIGNLLMALNASAAQGWGLAGHPGAGRSLEQALGVSYLVTPHLGMGFEALDRMAFLAEGLRAGIYAGPAVSYRSKAGWAVFSFTPQVASIKPSFALDRKERVDVVENERFAGRLLIGFHL